jgi:hypothetical protein
MSAMRSILGVKRKSRAHRQNVEIDPQQTFDEQTIQGTCRRRKRLNWSAAKISLRLGTWLVLIWLQWIAHRPVLLRIARRLLDGISVRLRVFDRRFVRLNGETAPASVVFNGHVRGFHVASRQVVAVPFPSSIDFDRPHR